MAPDERNQREKASAALRHLRLPLPSWDLGIRQKWQSLKSLPFSSSFHFPVSLCSSGSTDTQSDLCCPLRCTWIFGKMQMGKKETSPHLSSDSFYESLNHRPCGILCSYNFTTLRLPYGFHSGSFLAKSYYTHILTPF